MISTTTIIFPPNLLRFPTNGDFRLLLLNHFENFLVSQTLLPRAMLNDERVYPEPQEFRPERFLKNGVLDNSVRDPMDISFGFGRRCAFFSLSCLIVKCPSRHRSNRVCPGKHIAHSTVTLAAASVLFTFDLLRKADENGREIKPKREYTTSGKR